MANEPLPAQICARPATPKPITNPSSAPVTVDYARRNLKIYLVTESELESLVEGNTSVDLTFFGICFGSLVSLVGTLVGLHDGTAHAIVSGLVIVFLLGSIAFGITGWRNNIRLRRQLLKLKHANDEANQSQQ